MCSSHCTHTSPTHTHTPTVPSEMSCSHSGTRHSCVHHTARIPHPHTHAHTHRTQYDVVQPLRDEALKCSSQCTHTSPPHTHTHTHTHRTQHDVQPFQDDALKCSSHCTHTSPPHTHTHTVPSMMSCSHSGTTHSVFIRSRIVSSTALKLFSLGLRRMMTLNVSYTSSLPYIVPVMSCWY